MTPYDYHPAKREEAYCPKCSTTGGLHTMLDEVRTFFRDGCRNCPTRTTNYGQLLSTPLDKARRNEHGAE